MTQAYQDNDEAYFTDRQLKARWHCSHMKLYRLRAEGILPPPIKIGGRGTNLTPAEAIKQLEQAPVGDERAA